MSQQRDPYGIPINPHRSYEQYGANAMNEGGGFLETRGQGYAENMTTEGNPRRQERKTENIADQGADSQRYGSDSRDDDMYGIGLGGGDRHHIPGDLEATQGDNSSRRQDEDLYEGDTGLQQQQGRQQYQDSYEQDTGLQQQQGRQQYQDSYEQDTGLQQQQGRQQGRQQQSTDQNQKGDSMLGKLMEKTGGALGNKHLEEQGREKRNDPRNYGDRD